MAISSRQGLIDYCLRRLGFPVIEINVDDDQIQDRIDDALQYFQEFHFDGVERIYLQHQITGATLKFSGLSTPSFEDGEMLIGATSGAVATRHMKKRFCGTSSCHILTFFRNCLVFRQSNLSKS